MAARSKARRRALDILFEADLRGSSPLDGVAAMRERQAAQGTELQPYAADIVTGAVEHLGQIDETIARYAIGWTVERMPTVDRNVLRIGVWELLFNPEVDDGVAISEAKKLVSELSTDQSADFIQGVLGRVASMRDAEEAALVEPIVIEQIEVAPTVVQSVDADSPGNGSGAGDGEVADAGDSGGAEPDSASESFAAGDRDD